MLWHCWRVEGQRGGHTEHWQSLWGKRSYGTWSIGPRSSHLHWWHKPPFTCKTTDLFHHNYRHLWYQGTGTDKPKSIIAVIILVINVFVKSKCPLCEKSENSESASAVILWLLYSSWAKNLTGIQSSLIPGVLHDFGHCLFQKQCKYKMICATVFFNYSQCFLIVGVVVIIGLFISFSTWLGFSAWTALCQV